MVIRLSKAGLWVWFNIAILTWLVVCPASSESFNEIPGISEDMTIPPMGPVIFGTTQNSTNISIIAETSCSPIVRYANESYFSVSQNYDHELLSSYNSRNHTIRITGLEPGIQYHYQINGCGILDIDRKFSTFPVTGSCTFIVYGDTREQAPYFTQTGRHKIVADRIGVEPNISFVINTGDLVSNAEDAQEWDRFFRAGKTLFATTTYAVARGNHDSNLSLLKDLFGYDGMYSFDCGDAHIAVVDSTDNARFSPAEQALWLAEDLASTKKWKIVIVHHPLYTSEENHFGGFANLQKKFEPVFLSGNASVVFNGHVHAYERIEHSGIEYITEGRGGAPAYKLNKTKMDGSVRSLENSLGYSRVTVNPTNESLQIEVMRVADVSPDLRNVTQIFPMDTIIDRIDLKKPDQQNKDRNISLKPLPFVFRIFSCKKEIIHATHDLSPGHIPSCVLGTFD